MKLKISKEMVGMLKDFSGKNRSMREYIIKGLEEELETDYPTLVREE